MTAVVPRRTSATRLVVEDPSGPEPAAPEPAVARGIPVAVTEAKADARRAARALHDAVVWSDRSVYRGSQWRPYRAPVVPTDESTATDQDTGGIGRAAGKGLRWSLIGAFATRFGGLGLGMILARLLTPADFGLPEADAARGAIHAGSTPEITAAITVMATTAPSTTPSIRKVM